MTKMECMSAAADLAKQAAQDGEVPVGAVIVKDGRIISRGRNRSEKNGSALYHAEIEAIDSACKTLKKKYLSDCEMYVTLEPCPMCAGAIIHARLGTVVFGSYNNAEGACFTKTNLFELFEAGKNIRIIGGYCEKECSEILQNFFNKLRNKKNP